MAGLDIRITRPDYSEINNDKPDRDTLNMKISTWMELYANLLTSEYRADMRDVSIYIAEALREEKIVAQDHGSFISKYAASSPYHYFLTMTSGVESTHDQIYSVKFHEIIDYTIGEIVESLHLCGSMELSWIVTEYMLAAQDPRMTIIYDDCLDSFCELDFPFDIDFIPFSNQLNVHNSNISILKYKDNKIRIIISGANFRNNHWSNHTLGLWVSPLLPLLQDNANPNDGESITNFKSDFIDYLNEYKQPEVFGWIALIQIADFSAVNVSFIASIPGVFDTQTCNKWGLKKMDKILTSHVSMPSNSESWPIVAASACIGSLENDYKCWLESNIVQAFSKEKTKDSINLPDIKIIYPSQRNVNESIADRTNLQIFYSENTYLNQPWTNNYLYQWKSEEKCRTQAINYTNFYTRISPDESQIAWFLLTSCNLSQNGWGKMILINKFLEIQTYEAGILFTPDTIINQTSFPIKESNSQDISVFLLPFDVPITKYNPDDKPYLTKETLCIQDRLQELNIEFEDTEDTEEFSNDSDDDEPYVKKDISYIKRKLDELNAKYQDGQEFVNDSNDESNNTKEKLEELSRKYKDTKDFEEDSSTE